VFVTAVAVVGGVAFFLLGPTEVYKISRDVGKFVGTVRELATNSYSSFTASMEEELERQQLQVRRSRSSKQ
jgi:Sec-independent protein translocase protein TatA